MLLWLVVLFACKPVPPVQTDTDDVLDTDTDTDTDTDAPIDTAAETPVIDCAHIPQPPFNRPEVEAARAYHGITFSEAGDLIGSDSTNFIAASSPTESRILFPNLNQYEQIVMAPNGFIYGIQGGAVKKISPTGAVSTVVSGLLFGYGITLGPDNMLYAADQQKILRIDPTTDHTEEVLRAQNPGPKVVNFSPDGSKLYYGTISFDGAVYVVDLDANMNPVGEPQVFANIGGYHDGLDVDVCGNLYLADYNTRSLYRIDPEGHVQNLVNYAPDDYGHGLTFGNGVGPWDDHRIYQPQPYNDNTVISVDVGIPQRAWRGGDYETTW